MTQLHPGRWWHRDEESKRIVCDLCPRQCSMKEGDRGFCFVRKIEDGQMVLDTYGRSTGFCVDPIEKKPLYHFFPGTSVLSFGTAGCNLGCQFCQNWDISKSREVTKLSSIAEPELIAHAAHELGCQSVAFTYNDPVIWAEYAIDTAKACRALGVKSVAVTAGYISPQARRDFYVHMDAANVDLKAFTEDFYRKITYSHLEPVLDTLRYLKRETDVWFEITNLVIPGANDSEDELQRMCDWIVQEIGDEVPVHFSAFHPDFRMMDRPRTPHETLIRAHEIAKRAGLHYPYIGNVHDPERGSTYCPSCNALLIERDWYELGKHALQGNLCSSCGTEQAGRFARLPGAWGRKRQPVNLDSFRHSAQLSMPGRVLLPIVQSPDGSSSMIAPAIPAPPASPNEEAMSSPSMSAPVKLEMLKLDELTDEQKRGIHRAAQIVVVATACGRSISQEWLNILGDTNALHVMGMFVTLTRNKQLRGCCGFLGRPTQLGEAIIVSSQQTAKEDSRMPPISTSELNYLNLDVSILASPMVLTCPASERANFIEIGKHGLKISRGSQSGLLLPSVPVDLNWTVEEFLEGVCRKAGLPETAWKESDTLLERFEGIIIEGKIDQENLPSQIPPYRAPGDIQSLLRLKQVATQNLIAFAQGATPTYYALNAMDGNVHGVVLTVLNSANNKPLAHWIKTSMRPGIPLQSSLLELCQSAANVLAKARFEKPTDIELVITVLFDPAHHGFIPYEDWNGDQLNETLSRCEIEGLQSSSRAIVALCGERAAVAFDAEKSVHALITEAASEIKTRRNPIGIYSMGCMSTSSSLLASNSSAAISLDDVRPPAIAEGFYPSKPEARRELVARLKSNVPAETVAEPALALMTPHAGLRYSGQVAMDVWSRVQLPSTLLIIGPKHTHFGCDWAVSPSKAWELPGDIRFECDKDLTHLIASKVEGMELDLAAHAREHGAEIQLPILEALTTVDSRPKLVVVAMKSANKDEIDLASLQLADVLRDLPERPLLVISSDMNHYAPEAENRRRDRLALDAMLTGDPQKLIDVCQQNETSMCGLVPAAIVMKTLLHLGEKFRVEEVAYENSANRGGDPHRVVGYAGVVIRPA